VNIINGVAGYFLYGQHRGDVAIESFPQGTAFSYSFSVGNAMDMNSDIFVLNIRIKLLHSNFFTSHDTSLWEPVAA